MKRLVFSGNFEIYNELTNVKSNNNCLFLLNKTIFGDVFKKMFLYASFFC